MPTKKVSTKTRLPKVSDVKDLAKVELGWSERITEYYAPGPELDRVMNRKEFSKTNTELSTHIIDQWQLREMGALLEEKGTRRVVEVTDADRRSLVRAAGRKLSEIFLTTRSPEMQTEEEKVAGTQELRALAKGLKDAPTEVLLGLAREWSVWRRGEAEAADVLDAMLKVLEVRVE